MYSEFDSSEFDYFTVANPQESQQQNQAKAPEVIPFFQNYATIVRKCKDDYMKVNYPERIDATAKELKIILSQQRTITRSTKNSNTLLVKVGV
jgi:hypothetical protein